jgi:hypothetical protein
MMKSQSPAALIGRGQVDEHKQLLKGGYRVGRSRRSLTRTRIGRTVSCQPIATPNKFDQNAINNSAGMAWLLCGSIWWVNVLSSL